MEESFNIAWDDGPTVGHLDMCEEVVVQDIANETIAVNESNNTDNVLYMQHTGENNGNVVYMHSDGVLVDQTEQIPITEEGYIECQVAEEIITEEWVQPQADERVEIVGDYSSNQIDGSDDIEIPLPTDQDEYTTSRPYPCDFCSRRFRKKANLMNHMVAHQTDRPHGCNLCGARYIRKCDLMNHLKIHAYVPEPETYEDDEDDVNMNYQIESDGESRPRKKKNSSKKKKSSKIKVKQEIIEEEKYSVPSRSYDYVDEDMKLLTEMANSSARTLEYGNSEYSEMLPPENHPISEPRYPITDPRKPFVCQHCGVGFAREKALASHARIHGGDSPFECETCNDMFWDIALLKEHVRNKHGNTTDHLGFDNDDDEDYVDEEDRFGDYFCQTCGMTFHRPDLLRRHSRIHIKEEFVNEAEFGHVCNVCGDSFPEALDLLAHAEVHARLDIHRCMLCGESFADEQAMAAHIAQRHGKNVPPNTCMLCGKTCKDRRTLLKHSWEHSREKTFSCSKCNKSFHNKARLRRHMISHRNKSVTCNVCGEDFPDGRSLMNHRHSHTNMSGRQFPCRECGKTFGSRSSQQIHIRIHTGERPYGCRFCWKAFADGGTLRKHERIHTGEKPYACAVCPRAFNQRVVLREHIRSHHSGPDPKYGTTMTPYSCSVCNDLFSTSQDLIVHLIHHCDLNTAMKRQPQVGPRKYKRRRKLKPHELERLAKLDDPDELLSDSDDNSKRKLGRKNKKPKSQQSIEENNYESVFQSFESAVQTINNLVNSTKPNTGRGRKKKVTNAVNNEIASSSQQTTQVTNRPKMIHTQKTRVAVEVSSSDGSKVRHKTKTLITRTTPTQVVNVNNGQSDKSPTGSDKNNERNRPRTKNVSYHVLQPEKYPTATFDQYKQEIIDDILVKSEPENKRDSYMDLEEMFYHMNNDYGVVEENHTLGIDNNFVAQNIEVSEEVVPEVENEEVYIEDAQEQPEQNTEEIEGTEVSNNNPIPVNIVQILRGPMIPNDLIESHTDFTESVLPETLTEQNESTENIQEQSDISGEMTEISVQKRHQVNIKLEPLETTSLYELAELSMQHAQNKFKCEMCSATFSDRGQLLLHVPVHI